MTKDQFYQKIENVLSEISDKVQSKNEDYTGGSDDPFKCFRSNRFKTRDVIFREIEKKYSRLDALLDKTPNNESLVDTLDDIIASCAILKVWEESCES